MDEARSTPPSPDAERGRLADLFRTDLAAADAARETPDDAEVAAYLDGTLDDADREAFAMRLEDDPLLRAEVDALAALRRELGAPRRPTKAWVWALAAALVVTLGAAFLWRAKTVQMPPAAGANSAMPPLIASLTDSPGVVSLDASGVLHGLRLSGDFERQVAAALRDGALPRSAATDGLGGHAGVLMGGAPAGTHELAILAPIATAVRETTPTLRWHREPGARSYRAEVFDADLTAVARSAPLERLDWTVAPPLVRGHVYTWQVTAETSGGVLSVPAPPQPEARFRVLDEASATAVASDLLAAGGSHLAAAVAFARAGLYADAAGELDALSAANAGSPVLARLRSNLANSP